jgi:hypothetical protein
LILGSLNKTNKNIVDLTYYRDDYEKQRDERLISKILLNMIAWPATMTIGMFLSKLKWYICIIPFLIGLSLIVFNGLAFYIAISAVWGFICMVVYGLTDN